MEGNKDDNLTYVPIRFVVLRRFILTVRIATSEGVIKQPKEKREATLTFISCRRKRKDILRR